VIANVYARIGILVLSSRVSPAAAGLYAAALGLNQMVSLVPSNLALDLYRQVARDPDTAADAYGRYLRRTLAVTAPVLVLLWCLAPQVVRLLYGPAFAESATLLRIVVLAALPFTLSVGLSHVLLGTGRVRVELTGVGTNTALALVIYQLGTARFGVTGAAVAAALTPLPLLVYQLVRLKGHAALRHLKGHAALRHIPRVALDLWPLLLWGAGAAAAARLIPHWVVAAAVAVVAYVPCLLLSHVLDARDRAVIERAVPRIGRRVLA
jgi:O-antigen/teichoic acid export membrane protein